MRCPKCGAKAPVADGVISERYNEAYRQRVCSGCGHMFHTVEFEVLATDDHFQKAWSEKHKKNNKEKEQ